MFQTQKQQAIFFEFSSIRDEAISLYKVLAHSLTHLIAALNPRNSEDKFKEKAKRLGKKLIPYHSAAEIDGFLGDMEASIGKFRDCLQSVRDKYLVAINENGRDNLNQGTIN